MFSFLVFCGFFYTNCLRFTSKVLATKISLMNYFKALYVLLWIFVIFACFFLFCFFVLFFVFVFCCCCCCCCVCVCVCVCVRAHVLEFGSLHTNMHVKCSMLSIVNIQCDFLVLFGLKPDSYDVLYL